ncbi:hypothetical protein IE077_003988 [Cardiosporidium cionae]|uniref:Uncharacterized protein n=1 Tax=Cardiosporidium cionae TaxID=476202 RepID=A0ABQ7JEE3_9APIC|nr:hypothetical protein IE077_003988 [Cardiosporidium cionae]|eukprot:KAF8822334.1 hypothetical protein IE077_003988 [Cardiosporidium cionae]
MDEHSWQRDIRSDNPSDGHSDYSSFLTEDSMLKHGGNLNTSRSRLKQRDFGKNTSSDTTIDDSTLRDSDDLHCEGVTPSIPCRFYGFCWNSIWMLSLLGIFFLGLHASLLGWRIYGNEAADVATTKSCAHVVSLFPDGKIRTNFSFLSEFTFIECFIAFATAFLLVRKFRNPFLIENYLILFSSRHSCRGASAFYTFQGFFQLLIICFATLNISLAWMTGYGSPSQILGGLFLSAIALWVFTVLAHVLEVDRHPRKFTATLDFFWLWMIAALVIFWLCGILFYISVFGLQWNNYFVPHITTWCFFIIATFSKFKSIFLQSSHVGAG